MIMIFNTKKNNDNSFNFNNYILNLYDDTFITAKNMKIVSRFLESNSFLHITKNLF